MKFHRTKILYSMCQDAMQHIVEKGRNRCASKRPKHFAFIETQLISMEREGESKLISLSRCRNNVNFSRHFSYIVSQGVEFIVIVMGSGLPST